MTLRSSTPFALGLLLLVGAAPGCVYAHVPLARGALLAPGAAIEGSFAASSPEMQARASLDGACASTGGCAPGIEVSATAAVEIVDLRSSSSSEAAYASASGAASGGVSYVAVGPSGGGSGAAASGTAYESGAAAGGTAYESGVAAGGAAYEGGAAAGGAGTASDVGSTGASSATGATFVAVPTAGTSLSIDGAAHVTGAGRGLLSIARDGTMFDGRIAALDLLVPLAGGSFSADARIGGDASFSADASLAHDALPRTGGSTSVVLRVAGGAAPSRIPPLRVHLVIDASTSMQSTWVQLQEAALHLIARLRAEDELQIVVYGNDAREALPAIRVGDGARARGIIRALRPGGRTNIEAGLRVAYGALRAHASIVVVLSDGVPNGGLSTPAELGALAAEAHGRGAVTTAIGIGWDFHPGILRALADQGQGSFRIAPRITELGAILEAEITARGRVAAHDVDLSIALGPGVRLGSELPAGLVATAGGARFTMPTIGAGEERILVVPVEVPPGTDARSVAQIDARWTPMSTGAAMRATKPLALAVAAQPVLAGSALAVLDADLAMALGLAATAVTNGDGAEAAVALRAHAARARVHVRARPMAALDARIDHVATLAGALERMVPSASWHDRRALGASMVSFSVAFGR